ncbi:MAG: patatin-like phospholipase family protein [Epsilonproteobacteria bacterium]|nr:patatin-like phospholipase family protein [Campylobacterota bacterium]
MNVSQNSHNSMVKIGLALSGGGARCIAQLGAMHYFEELGIEISAISGSSGGAIVAGLYASGLTIEEIYTKLSDLDFKSHLKYSIRDGSLYHLRDAIDDLQEIFGKKDIQDLNIPFFCTVVDYQLGKEVYINQGDMVTYMMASAALVPFFSPVKIENKVYVDGGFCDNLPSYPLTSICHKIIGVNVNPVPTKMKFSFAGHLKRSLMIMLHTNIRAGEKACDFFMEIEEMGNHSIFDLKNFALFFDLGYNEAKKYTHEIERLL